MLINRAQSLPSGASKARCRERALRCTAALLRQRRFRRFLDRVATPRKDIARADTCIWKQYLFSRADWIICASR